MKKTILHITSEVAPFYKRGGLGDVLGALPKYLVNDKFENVVVSLYYKDKMLMPENYEKCKVEINLYGIFYDCFCYYFIRDSVKYCFLNLSDEYIFSSSESSKDGDQPYSEGISYMHYLYFAKAVLAMAMQMKIHPDFILCHDWQTAGIFAFKKDLEFLKTKNHFITLYIIHNYEFQGEILKSSLKFLPEQIRNILVSISRKYGSASMLALATEYSDFIGTVSQDYATALKAGDLPHKRLKLLDNRDRVLPFLNGVDYSIWHPNNSPYLDDNYHFETVENKEINKKNVWKLCGFDNSLDVAKTPLILIMSRLTPQKGIQLFLNEYEDGFLDLDNLFDKGFKLIIYGSPSKGLKGAIHKKLQSLQSKFKDHIFYDFDYNEEKAHLYLAASDMLLAPSLFEPCGLVQIYAMAFGTIPIVRPVGGMKDTVSDYFEDKEHATGFYIKKFSLDDLKWAILQACNVYKNEPENWLCLIENAMSQDYSWGKLRNSYFRFFEGYKETQNSITKTVLTSSM